LAIWLYFSLSSTGFDPLKRLNLRFRTQPVDNHVDKSFLGKRSLLAKWLYFSLSSTGFGPSKRLNPRFRTQPVDNHVDKSF